ncbi:MAG: mechanosensitive ion channel [Alistipes sp.]|jgi:small conductance mechanosensitive channel|nr:mechanosensitive ion channel [Alistipes sp.]
MFLPMQLPGVDQQEVERADSLLRADIQNRVHTFAGMTWEERFHAILNDLWDVGLKLVVVIAIFIVGRWLIGRVVKLIGRLFERRKVDASLRTFVRSMVEIVLYLVLIYLMIAWLGVDTSLFVALFAAAGLAVGMALSGVFQNFAGGVMILLLKPFRNGDWIELQGQAGTVMDIRLFNTVLRTSDNKTILLPNGSVSTGIINNHNAARTRRLEWTVSLEIGADFEAAKKVLLELLTADGHVNTIPAPEVLIAQLNPASLDIVVHAWVASGEYWDVLYRVNEAIYRTLPERGFNFSHPLASALQQQFN